MLPLLALMTLVASIIINLESEGINPVKFIISWILLFALAIIVLLIKIERKNAQRIKTDKTGAFNSINTLKFFDDKLVMENDALRSTGELKYDQFYALRESRDYFIFYWTANQASLIRKKDVDNLNSFRDYIIEKFKGRYKRI